MSEETFLNDFLLSIIADRVTYMSLEVTPTVLLSSTVRPEEDTKMGNKLEKKFSIVLYLGK